MDNQITQGFYRISHDEYHSSKGVSRSYLHRMIDKTPAHAIIHIETTPILQFGQDFHVAVLEPDRFDKNYVVYPAGCLVGSGKGQRERKQDFDNYCATTGKSILKPDDLEKIKHMREAVFNHPEAKELLSDGEPELSGYWIDHEREDLLCKLRMDWINKRQRVIVDLKKTRDARQHRFTSQAYDLGYDMEAAFYCYGATQITGIEHQDFYFIACEDEPPWGVIVYKVDMEMINHGLLRCSRALTLHLECVKNNDWPCYSQEVQNLGLPEWVTRKEEVAPIFD